MLKRATTQKHPLPPLEPVLNQLTICKDIVRRAKVLINHPAIEMMWNFSLSCWCCTADHYGIQLEALGIHLVLPTPGARVIFFGGETFKT